MLLKFLFRVGFFAIGAALVLAGYYGTKYLIKTFGIILFITPLPYLVLVGLWFMYSAIFERENDD